MLAWTRPSHCSRMCGKFGLVTCRPALSIGPDLPFGVCSQQHISEGSHTTTPFSVDWSPSAAPDTRRVPREDEPQGHLGGGGGGPGRRRNQPKEKNAVQPRMRQCGVCLLGSPALPAVPQRSGDGGSARAGDAASRGALPQNTFDATFPRQILNVADHLTDT